MNNKITLLTTFFLSVLAQAQIAPVMEYATDGFYTLSDNATGWAQGQLQLQSTGKILFSSNKRNGTDCCQNFVMRLDTDGSLDTTFATSGFVTNLPSDDNGSEIKLTSTGFMTLSDTYPGFALAKYTTDGALDTSFATNGVYNATDKYSKQMYVDALDNSYVGFQGSSSNGILKLTSAGVVDTSFGTSGVVRAIAGDFHRVVAVTNNSVYYVIAQTDTTPYKAYLVKADHQGVLDTNFGVQGKYELYSNTSTDDFDMAEYHFVLEPTTNQFTIVIFEDINTISMQRISMATAALDTNFATTGVANLAANFYPASFVKQQGNYYIAGLALDGAKRSMFLTRYTSQGNLDTSFGTNGVYKEHRNGTNDWLEAIQVDANENIFVAGEYQISADDNALFVAKYAGQNSLSTPEFSSVEKTVFYHQQKQCFTVVEKDKKVKQITLKDLSTKTYRTLYNTNTIGVADLASGLYLLDITFTDGSHTIAKVMR